ncbi:MAG: methyltransferase [Candidatus ainarchaeum sp.]|nr:methyltransferase [Candidatus ainarchaeum sp.]
MQVYAPQEDSFLLEEEIKKENLSEKKCLDLGTGSGIQAKAMFFSNAKKVFCVDVNYKALLLTQKNLLEYKDKFVLIESDLFSSLKGEKFDFIAFNPPYLPSDEIKWKDLDGGKKGRVVINKFLEQLSDHVNPNFVVLLLVSSLNNEEEIISFLEEKKYCVEIVSSKKLFFEELFVLRITAC